MAIVPDTTTDTGIHGLIDHELWPGGPSLPNEVPMMTDEEKLERLFGGELKQAEAVQAAMNRLERIMHKPYATRRMIYDRIPVGHDIGYRCYDAGKHDAESAFTSGEFGDGLSENEAYADWLRNIDEPEGPATSAERELDEAIDDGITFDDDLE